jgi:hypothetical protein
MQCDYYLPEAGISEMKQHNGMRHPGVAIGVLYNRFLDTVERLT